MDVELKRYIAKIAPSFLMQINLIRPHGHCYLLSTNRISSLLLLFLSFLVHSCLCIAFGI